MIVHKACSKVVCQGVAKVVEMVITQVVN